MKINNTRLIFLYRTILFNKVHFETDDKKLNDIVIALNIKNKKKRAEYVYDKAIEFINNYYNKDLCKFKNKKCIVQRKNKSKNIGGCCPKKCIYYSDKGCTTKCLECKMVYCKTALKNKKRLYLFNIPILKCLPFKSYLVLRANTFTSREDNIYDLSHNIIIYCFRLTYRVLFINPK